ncbi:hypothetical protein EST38_g726 [Candolleomyces aberdarensis]|uniref:Peptidase S9 prolyl oligopeptidase catalytic domain-containing protein n=1 Tax=Candolleomyces aberdarensis TaxID=2316362 RepID=A0A4Q2DXP1_9AGAR|nr:hypothetical protein EST38_g726 [Candolleomyces aberdarensis]
MSTSASSAAYGTWKSPITAEAITKNVTVTETVLVDQATGRVYHIERRPSEQGRSVLVETDTGKDVVGQEWNVRTGVHEYGGSAALVHDGVAYFSNYSDGRIYVVTQGQDPQAVTPGDKPYRYANFEVHPRHPHLLASVLEDHSVDTPATIVSSLCIVNTQTKSVHPLISGTDFYALPKFSPDGNRLAWQQWSHPDMPWQGGQVLIGDVVLEGDSISVSNSVRIAGETGRISAGYPTWANDNTLIFTSDHSGYSNPWKFEGGKASPILSQPVKEEFAPPMWSLDMFPYSIVDSAGTQALWTAVKDGRDTFYIVDIGGKNSPQQIDTPFVAIRGLRSLSQTNHEVVFCGQKVDEPETIVQASTSDLQNGSFKVLTQPSAAVKFSKELVSPPRSIALTVPDDGSPLYVVFYGPHNPSYSGSNIPGERPPCVVNVHGGPTAQVGQGLDWKKQYFTTRGWAWLDVNYGGSSGYGRAYVERLDNHWGQVDVEDSILAAKVLSQEPYNLIDPKRVVVRGGSAGGFTTLAAISIASDLKFFAAAQSSYGVSDLQKLDEFTHKFESHYLNKLIGGTFAEVPEIYKARSPIYHADSIVTPLLILQGEIDKVVPKEQSELIYQSIKERGGVVEYKLYPGEGHGWRQEATMRDALERELGFFSRILGISAVI